MYDYSENEITLAELERALRDESITYDEYRQMIAMWKCSAVEHECREVVMVRRMMPGCGR